MGRPRKIDTLIQTTGAMDAQGAPIRPKIEEKGKPVPPGVGPRTEIDPPKTSKEQKLNPTREKKAGDEAVVPDLPILNNNKVPAKPKSPLGNSTLSGMIHQAHGHIETFKPTTLAQILGSTGMNKYGTMDENEYTSSLASMNKADLQTHATKVGLVPIDDRDRLVKRLVHEFRLHVASFNQPAERRSAPRPMVPEVAKILAAGR
jgi:hypothetical protein